MKPNYLKSILINILFLIFISFGYVFPKYSWSIQIVLFITVCLGIFGCLILINNIDILSKELTSKFDSFTHNFIGYFFDVITLLFFIILDYRILFFLYIILFLCLIVLKKKYKRSKIK